MGAPRAVRQGFRHMSASAWDSSWNRPRACAPHCAADVCVCACVRATCHVRACMRSCCEKERQSVRVCVCLCACACACVCVLEFSRGTRPCTAGMRDAVSVAALGAFVSVAAAVGAGMLRHLRDWSSGTTAAETSCMCALRLRTSMCGQAARTLDRNGRHVNDGWLVF